MDMAGKFAIVVTVTTLFSFCFDVAKCETGYVFHPGPYDTTLVSITCNNEHFELHSPYDTAAFGVMNDLLSHTSDHGFNYYSYSRAGGETAYGHAACNGKLTKDACGLCLIAAFQDIYSRCRVSVGVQIQLRDCRMRYENYSFTE